MNELRMPKPGQGRSIFARFATPHTFHPDLSLAEAVVAVAAVLTRIFGGCLLFAACGGAAGLAWTAIASHFWRVAAVVLLLLLFLATLAGLLFTVSALERRIVRR
jgi:hypothetical protein